jgi:hypothetical protein
MYLIGGGLIFYAGLITIAFLQAQKDIAALKKLLLKKTLLEIKSAQTENRGGLN